ncbi:MAG TPA: hypothetical protein VN911_18675 [Candidatus Acidoferrum sp.]|jgi:hypothetical protein|nr:hypothetical protein [Candidatus Acidoferrum sp.]
MLNDEPTRQAGIARLISDIRSAKVELLSAQCAADRLRMQYSVEEIVCFGERQALITAMASADAVCRFFASIGAEMKKLERQQ